MNDPYKVLGVSPSATDEEVKKAYRELAKKYHPDRYADSPLADLASEKMKEVNEAYDQILDERKTGTRRSSYGSGSSYSYGSGSSYSYGSSASQTEFNEIRIMINSGNFQGAEAALAGIPSDRRSAEWYYLMGVVFYKKGFLEDAYNYFQTACRMDPSNIEYQSMFNRIQQQRSGAQGGFNNNNTQTQGCCVPDCCDICTCLMCTDCLCNMCH